MIFFAVFCIQFAWLEKNVSYLKGFCYLAPQHLSLARDDGASVWIIVVVISTDELSNERTV